ncbi:hypothetical protein [Gordonibacter massiliensis (ex Traore et al. 2017)]|uniref:hypothetical protein n=1 Tax=Gordonibacter massiliensis (ex Traore et al. 2017) TaxID=1841863 RepID=UPI001C8C7541|nr:hypothetical protein [Gordonibacter massiliensis (ex Traore et al. 2017)]MBX9035313.1 hypothetical protein [Gordonibacter massiliensis (ex Traore et al. 2017)]
MATWTRGMAGSAAPARTGGGAPGPFPAVGRAALAAALAVSLAAPAAPALASDSLEASTAVSVEAAALTATPSPDVSCALSEVASHAVSVTVGNAAGAPAVSWSRTRGGAHDPSFSSEGGTCPLADIDAAGSYVYTARVVDGWGREASASVAVEVRDDGASDPEADYVRASVADAATGVRVSGSIHKSASLVVVPAGRGDAAYRRLAEAAGGRGVAAAWTVSLEGAPRGSSAFRGVLTVELPDVRGARAASAARSSVEAARGIAGASAAGPAPFGFAALPGSSDGGVRAVAPLASEGSADVLLLPEGGEGAVFMTGSAGADAVAVCTGSLGAFALLEDSPVPPSTPAGPGEPRPGVPSEGVSQGGAPLTRTGDAPLGAASTAALAVAALALVAAGSRLRPPAVVRKGR